MDDRTLRVLEFPAIVARLAALTVTARGRELAEALRPSPDPGRVRAALAETAEAAALVAEGEIPLRGTADVREMLHRARLGAALDPSDLLALADTLPTIRQCRGYVLARRARAPALAEQAARMGAFEALEAAIRRTVAPDGTIPDAASPHLARLRREQQAVHGRLRETLEAVIRGPYGRMLQDAVITTRAGRYVVPVRAEFKGQFPGILHDHSSSGATAFMEPLVVVPLGNRLRELEIEERQEVQRLLRELSAQVGQQADGIAAAYEILGHLDCAVARARLGATQGAAAPAVRTDGVLRLRRARHPLLAGEVVPIDVELGERFTTLVITGPNTGGKTVTLKTVGLLTLMAQAGLFIPAEPGSEVAVFAQVFADIGDEQSIEQSLSTFSSHMGAIVQILHQVDRAAAAGGVSALVLLDEIGAGTDPTEGVALARAVIEHLHGRGARTVVTTHYNELKALAWTHPGIENASVEFDPVTLRPTYRLRIGLPGRSNALDIARRLGLAADIVERARELLGPQAGVLDRILSDLEADRRASEHDRAEAARRREEAEAVLARARQELERLRAERAQALRKAREEVEALLRSARSEVDALVRALRESPDPRTVQQARDRLRQLADDLRARTEVEPAGEPLQEAHPGQDVYVVPLGRIGTVVAGPDGRGEVEVQAGPLRVRAPLASLRAAPPPAAVAGPAREEPVLRQAPAAVPLSVNLRGLTADEATAVLDRYLDDAFLAGLAQVTVIHGKGTGALRRAVHQFLRDHPHVRAFRPGGPGEGGDGVTVVELATA
ncbi:MAG: endonuclease MutS2 [Armatimonadota bacterium]|nr:endonuclease MutS2 [Armatimonadota bacterium]